MAIAGILNPGVCAYPPGRARRRFARRAVEAEGIGAELGEEARATVLNLSEGGLQVRSSKPLALASGALVSLSLPGGTAIRANCELMWSDASGAAGLRFLAFSENGKTRLANWLSSRSTEAPAPVERLSGASAPAMTAQDLPPNPTPAAGPSWSTEADEIGLEELIRKMMVMTAAEGAAIALRQDDAIVCRATAGNAPRLGAKLNPEAGLSGRCLRSGEAVLCRDSESDPTVNAEACRALRLRAALLVPVKRDGRAQGVLEVFSSKPDVFDVADIAALQRVSEMVAEYLPQAQAGTETPAAADAIPTEPPVTVQPEPAAVTTQGEALNEKEPGAGITPRAAVVWPSAVFSLIADPHSRPWKQAVYWSVITLRKALSLATWTVPLSYFLCFLVGPVIRPGAIEGTAVFGYIAAVVEPGMTLADYFFSFRAVIHGWNLMFVVMGIIAAAGRALALKPINFLLRKAEDLTQPRKRYAYVPYVPHRTEFR